MKAGGSEITPGSQRGWAGLLCSGVSVEVVSERFFAQWLRGRTNSNKGDGEEGGSSSPYLSLALSELYRCT